LTERDARRGSGGGLEGHVCEVAAVEVVAVVGILPSVQTGEPDI
jgi:hypothetical protein